MGAPNEILREVLLSRNYQNPSYSLRAFARDLGVSHSYLSKIIHKKRKLSLRHASAFASVLRLGSVKEQEFLRGVTEALLSDERSSTANNPQDKDFALDVERFRILSEWYHAAILEIILLERAASDPLWIARKLGIKSAKVKVAIRRLENCGLITKSSDGWVRGHQVISIPTLYREHAILNFHRQMITKALDAIGEAPTNSAEERDFSSITVAINPKRLAGAKKRIARFRKSMMKYLQQGEKSELYQLNIQLFNLAPQRVLRKKLKKSVGEIP
jgi:uncharacterized protein (TIGR02147 family)